MRRQAARTCLRAVRLASTAVRDDPHAILGVQPGASAEEVKAAYRKKALLTHPDRHGTEGRQAAEEAFRAVSDAFDRLSNKRGASRLHAGMSQADAESLFSQIFGPDGDVELAWRVPGRRAPRAAKSWQEYQARIESSDDTTSFSTEARALYRQCLRSLRGVGDAAATGVREHARTLYEANAHETDAARIRSLLVDGRHSLDEMLKCIGTAVTAAPPAPPQQVRGASRSPTAAGGATGAAPRATRAGRTTREFSSRSGPASGADAPKARTAAKGRALGAAVQAMRVDYEASALDEAACGDEPLALFKACMACSNMPPMHVYTCAFS